MSAVWFKVLSQSQSGQLMTACLLNEQVLTVQRNEWTVPAAMYGPLIYW